MTILRGVASWGAWAARGLAAGVLVGIIVGLTDSTLLHGVLWVGWLIGGAVALPMRQLLRVLFICRRSGVSFGVARAAVQVTTLWPYISWRSGHGQSEDEVRKARLERNPNLTEEDDHSWSDLARWGLYVVGLLPRRRTERFFDVPRLVSASATAAGMTLRVRRAKSGTTAEDVGSVESVQRFAQTLREVTGAWSLLLRSEVEGPHTVLRVLWSDPLQGSRPSFEPSGDQSPVRIGVDEFGSDVWWDPFEATHTAVQGMTRSGKSVQEYTRLSGLAGRTAVEVCGLDPTGVLLGPFVATGGRAAVPATAGESPMFAHFLDVLYSIVSEMDRRTMQLAADGKDKLGSGDFSADLPCLVVVLEEWPGIIRAAAAEDVTKERKPAERVGPKIEAGVARLLAEGAKSGIRVLLLGQRLSAKSLDTDSRSNFGVRHTLRVDNADAVGMLHDHASEWAPIVAVFEPGQGLIERPGLGQRRYRADFTSYDTYLRRVKESVAEHV
ncbi:hypothetical protein [Brevibacterium aurantiacum]|uniref:FtsK domain-containing protein n=2 Tax=Brevibacterium aurantiacum TaxID=273384 RepID=A0A2H1JZ87_BREAU|nr:hypothetical protein [Brevibacterium aurantiacum]SMX92779.1 hypothetical protein BAUR9175_02954 [Brevibacterium aurantiacum]